MTKPVKDSVKIPPFETADLRSNLTRYLDAVFTDVSGKRSKVGDYRWGIYAFFDYDGEPIYVGQTNEKLRTRIRRHLTNQRTDAVAISVLDPFEVSEIEVWPLPQFQNIHAKSKDGQYKSAKAHLNALERQITHKEINDSNFKAILNEKDPPPGDLVIEIPPSYRASIVSDRVKEIRSHPDFLIARRALISSRLAQVISERKVKGGLRRVLLTQAKRLQWLAERRYQGLGGAAIVEAKKEEEVEDDSD